MPSPTSTSSSSSTTLSSTTSQILSSTTAAPSSSPSQAPQATSSNSDSRSNAIGGGVVGGILGLVVLAIGAMWFYRLRNRRQRLRSNFEPSRDEEIPAVAQDEEKAPSLSLQPGQSSNKLPLRMVSIHVIFFQARLIYHQLQPSSLSTLNIPQPAVSSNSSASSVDLMHPPNRRA